MEQLNELLLDIVGAIESSTFMVFLTSSIYLGAKKLDTDFFFFLWSSILSEIAKKKNVM